MFKLSVKNCILMLSAYHCVPGAAYVNLKVVGGQTHDYCCFPLKRKKSRFVALPLSDVVSSSVIFLGKQASAVRNPPGALLGGWPMVLDRQKGTTVTWESGASSKSCSE